MCHFFVFFQSPGSHLFYFLFYSILELSQCSSSCHLTRKRYHYRFGLPQQITVSFFPTKRTHSNCKKFRFLLFVFVCLFFSLVFYWLGKSRYVSCLLSFLGVALLWKAHKGLNDFSKESDDSECLVNIVLCDCNLTQNIPRV